MPSFEFHPGYYSRSSLSSITAKYIFAEGKKICFLFQAALCADYSVPVDCVTAGPAPRPSSFHEISAPKVSALVMVTHSVNCQSGKCTSRTRLTFKDNVKLHKILALAHSDVGSRY